MTVCTNIAHLNENVISDKITMKITFVAKSVQATSFSLNFFSWQNKKWQNIRQKYCRIKSA